MIRNQLLAIDETKLYRVLMSYVKHKDKNLDATEWSNDYHKAISLYKFEDFLSLITPIFEQAGLTVFDAKT